VRRTTRAGKTERTLYSKARIARRIAEVARAIAGTRPRPEIAAPILVGAFVVAADLMRALAREGLDLETEFLWLRSYGMAETPGQVKVLQGPSTNVRGRTVLLIDGVLDSGATLARARQLLEKAGAKKVISAVAVSKTHPRRRFEADYALFRAGGEFLFGYGMDRAGKARGLADIRVKEKRRGN
jgi:hypoxanthine phosphoribosyltransferase